jgi:hypothetical protein
MRESRQRWGTMVVMKGDKPPTAAEVEERAQEYHELETKIDDIVTRAEDETAPLKKRYDELKEWFVDQVREFGSSHAEKSKILHGIAFEAMVTFGQSSSIDAAAVETFRLALVKADKPQMLKRLFEKTVRWTLAADAAAFIREHHAKLGARLTLMYARCTVTKGKSPQLTVREKQKAAAAS